MQQAMRGAFGRGRGVVSFFAAWALLLGLLWPTFAFADGLPSSRCPTLNASVAWGGVVNVSFAGCHDFGMGVLATAPAHGTASEGDPPPVQSYNYSHNGTTPAGGGTDQFVVLDDAGDFVTVNVTISAPTSSIVVSPGTLPTMTAGVPFAQTLTSSGGAAPYNYSISGGSLPPGLTISGSGTLSGTPTRRGAYAFSVRSQDTGGDFADKGYSGDVADPAMTISPTGATAIQGAPFSQTLSVSGGVAPYSFALEPGSSFPAGISISSGGVISGTTSAAPGSYPVQLRVSDSSSGDGVYHEIENFTLTVSAAPTVSIAVSPASVSEDGATNLVYTVTRSLNLTSATVVNITTSGTATSGTDYTGGVATVTIPAGATTATVTIDPTVDGTIEANETITLTVAAGTGYTVGAPASATGTILNDDVPSATISVSPGSVAEDGAPNLVYTVTLSSNPGITSYSINYTVSGTATSGSDYAAVTSPLVIPAGVLTGTITVNPTADATIEADETVIVSIAAGAGYTVGVPNSATGTILNDDAPSLTINDVSLSEGDAGTTAFTFTVSLSAPAGPAGVTFDIATANGTATAGSDYVANSLTGQTIPSGSSTYTFTVQATGDTLNEANETFFVNVTNVIGAVVVDGQGLGTINNDDALPSMSIVSRNIVERNSLTQAEALQVTLSAASGQTVTANYASANGSATAGSDYLASSGTVTFGPGMTTAVINVGVTGDTVPEADETFTVTLSSPTNATIATATGTYTIVNDDVPVTLSPTTISNGTVATAYSQTLTASGGTAPYSFAVTAGALPGGLTLAADGTLSGTPSAGGTFNFTVTATDSSASPGPFSGSQAYSLAIAAPTITVSPTTLPGATAGVAYSENASAGGGTAPYTFAVTAGALPAGMTLASNGTLSGTPTAGGTFNFTITATDSSTGTGPYTGSRAYSLTVAAATITIAPTTLPDATELSPYSQTLAASGGSAAYSFAVTAGALPPGLSLSSAGVISGTPSVNGTFNFTVTATDSSTGTGPYAGSRAYSLTVAMTPPVANAVSATVAHNSGANPITLNITAGTPSSVAIASAPANGTAIASGTSITYQPNPGYAGTDSFTYTATNAAGTSAPAAANITVSAPTITMTPSALGGAVAGSAYSETFSAGGGTAPYSFSLVSGALPIGMSFSSAGTFSGTPSVDGTFNFTVRATDANGFTGDQAYSLVVAAPTIAIAPSSLPDAVAGVAYSQTFTASGGAPSYSFSLVSGALPVGMSLSSAGAFSGTPVVAGTFNFTLRATDANGYTADQAYSFVVAAPTIAISPASLPGATAGFAYSQSFTGSGGSAPYSFSLVSGSLPVGMSMSSLGVFSGTPSMTGTYNFTVRATDANGFTGDRAYSVVVAAPSITVSPAALSDATAGVAYSQTFTAAGGVAPYSFSLVSGSLPVGMSMSSAGAFSGTPTVAGTYNFTVRATDTNGFTGDRAYSLVVIAPTITIAPSTLPNGVRGTSYAQTIAASGGTAPYSFALTSGALPAGIAMSSAGAFSGTPSLAGNYTFTVRATDALGFNATASYTVTIAEAIPVAVNDAATTLGTAPVTIAVTANDTGVITAVVAGTPSHGTAVVSGLNIVYTAAAGYSGSDSFTYQAVGPGGSSAPATVAITVNPVPVAVAKTANVVAGLPVTVDLTAGATGGPFTAATVVSVTPATSGTATIAPVGGSYRLTYTPVTSFSGQATVQFTLSNAFATSAPATVTITVAPRPDPTSDAEVRGLLEAQSDSARRFANSQIGNFQQRMENLHDNREGARMSNRLSFATSQACVDYIGRKPGDPCGNAVAANGPVATASAAAQAVGEGGSSEGSSNAPFSTWISGMIRSGNQDGRNGGAGADFETDGVSAGADYRFNPAFALGAGIGFGRDESDIGDNGSRVEGDAYALAVYASVHPGDRFFFDTVFGYQRLSYDLRRFVTASGGFVEGSRDGRQWFGSVSTGAQFQNGNWQLTPYARIDISRTTLDAYAEAGDPIYALAYREQDIDASSGNLGLRIEARHPTSWGAFAPQVRMEYQHDFSEDSSAAMQYADLITGPLYRADLHGFDRNRFMLGLGAMFYLPRDISLRAEYRGLFGNKGDRDNGVMLNFEKSY